MKRWWSINWKTGVWIAAALVIIVLGSLLLKFIGLDPNAFAAAASALAAVAAFGSARSSSTAARDAVRALALASKPAASLDVLYERETDESGNLTLNLRVSNNSRNAIMRSELTWTLHDGSTHTRPLGALAGVIWSPTMSGTISSYPLIRLPYPTTPGVDSYQLRYWGSDPSFSWLVTTTYEARFIPINDLQELEYVMHHSDETELK